MIPNGYQPNITKKIYLSKKTLNFMLGNTLNLGHSKNNGLLAFGLEGKYFENALTKRALPYM
jgi:hypothetical protein